ncbi:MAG: pyrroline-5-carboxylate reductase [Phycisphaerae bacterium]|nr:pyrroline-5-carboxylate reductase [Phycisphaerae bacterium]
MGEKVHELAIVGAGNMAEAIARGVLAAKLFSADQISAADPVAQRRELFTSQLGIQTTEAPSTNAKIILLSVKPQQMESALSALRAHKRDDTRFISIAAGIRTSTIEKAIGGGRVVRAMPNTPMLVGEGMTAICPGSTATSDDLEMARRLFQCAGKVVEVEESQMEAVTAVSGSGPAYVYYLAEHMIAAGVTLGLSQEQAALLARQTIAGAGRMLATSADSPQELRRKVTSPGGTTQAAIETLDQLRTSDAIQHAIVAAEKRGKELGAK